MEKEETPFEVTYLMSRPDMIESAVSIILMSHYIRERKFEEIQKLVKEEEFDLNQKYPFPLGCIFIYKENSSDVGYYEFKKTNESNQIYLDELEQKFEEIQFTPLQYASALGDLEIVEYLKKLGSNVKIKDETGRTAEEILHFLNGNQKSKL
jgi:hypothetical protein